MRQVILICGPPGAGKTTLAQSLGLRVYDRDDKRWRNEAAFLAAIKQLAHDPAAQAVVIRSGASASSRRRTASIVRATEIRILDTDLDTCIRRIQQRGRPAVVREIAGARKWWDTYTTSVPLEKLDDKYGADHRRERKKWKPIVESGQAQCAEPVCVMPTRWIDPASTWHLCHDPSGTRYIGVGHAKCNHRESIVRNRQPKQGQRRWVL